MSVFLWTLFGLAVGIGPWAAIGMAANRLALSMTVVLEHIDVS